MVLYTTLHIPSGGAFRIGERFIFTGVEPESFSFQSLHYIN
jgi:hypothetical protein